MLLQLLLVLTTFAICSVGGHVFSRYYFASSGMGITVRFVLEWPVNLVPETYILIFSVMQHGLMPGKPTCQANSPLAPLVASSCGRKPVSPHSQPRFSSTSDKTSTNIMSAVRQVCGQRRTAAILCHLWSLLQHLAAGPVRNPGGAHL